MVGVECWYKCTNEEELFRNCSGILLPSVALAISQAYGSYCYELLSSQQEHLALTNLYDVSL